MQIAYHAKYPLLVCVVLLPCTFYSPVKFCGNNNTSAEFQNNVKMLLKNLVENTSPSNGFNTSSYGRDPDRAYDLLQCRADTTVEECVSCSHEAIASMLNDCTNASSGRSMLETCFIRYKNYSFFGKLDIDAKIAASAANVTDAPEEFKEGVKELFRNLTEDAIQSPIKYAAVSTTTCPSFYIINGLLQYWWDLTSVQDCGTCLTSTIRQLPDVMFGADLTLQGGGSRWGRLNHHTLSFDHLDSWCGPI